MKIRRCDDQKAMKNTQSNLKSIIINVVYFFDVECMLMKWYK